MKIKLDNVKKVSIKDEYIKLDALLKYLSIAGTGGEAKFYIQNGDVSVCGAVCTQRGKKIKHGDTVRIGETVYLITRRDGVNHVD